MCPASGRPRARARRDAASLTARGGERIKSIIADLRNYSRGGDERVFYSIDLLPPFWQGMSMANPILHMVNAFRYGILGVSDIQIGVAIGLMLIAAVVLYICCIRLLTSGRGMRH